MIYIPQEIEEFTYTNAAALVSAYSDVTTYAVGDTARIDSVVYRSVLGSNTGNNPLENLYTHWIEWSSSNAHAMLDLFSETKTEWTGDGIVIFERGTKDTIAIGNFKATTITIEYLSDYVSEVSYTVDRTDTFTFSANREVYDVWTYGYGGFVDTVSDVVYTPIYRAGTHIRVTFEYGTDDATYCGFLGSGKAESMGETEDGVSFPDKRIGTKTIRVANFTTKIDNFDIMRKTSMAKQLVDIPMIFVIDPSIESRHKNMVVLGKINKVEPTGANATKNTISWEIEQNIIQ